MKREVLRLGGYARECFVSQTPELTQMGDVVIDLVALTKGEAAKAATKLLGFDCGQLMRVRCKRS